MGPGCFWMGGMWIFPVIMIVVMLTVVYLIFGRGGFRSAGCGPVRYYRLFHGQESALEILKKRYAEGEVTREEFEEIKREIS